MCQHEVAMGAVNNKVHCDLIFGGRFEPIAVNGDGVGPRKKRLTGVVSPRNQILFANSQICHLQVQSSRNIHLQIWISQLWAPTYNWFSS